MSEADNAALAAVIIAIIAFFVTTGQLLQAIFGTAEGYRRCQYSVIGSWAKLTRREWRWSEFRFETIFTTPDISLLPAYDIDLSNMLKQPGWSAKWDRFSYRASTSRQLRRMAPVAGPFPIGGGMQSRRETMVDSFSWLTDTVGWLALLDELHSLREVESLGNHRVFHGAPVARIVEGISWQHVPVVFHRSRSWDFMPTEIVRPFASSRVRDVVAIAHRLGMEWKDLRPADGVMIAEGSGHSISSTLIRGFGTLIQYTNVRGHDEDEDLLLNTVVASKEADKMGFGIIPKDHSNSLPEFRFHDTTDLPKSVRAALDQLGIENPIRDNYIKYVQGSGKLYGFSDLISLVAPWMPLEKSNIVQILPPYRDVADSPTNWYEGFVVFRRRLNEYIEANPKASDHLHWILKTNDEMRSRYPWNKCPSWEGEIANKEVKNGRSLDFLNEMRNIWKHTMDYFKDLHSSQPEFKYADLIAAHIAQAVTYPDLAEKNIKAGGSKGRYDLGGRRSKRMAEATHIYVDNIPKTIQFMKDRGFDNADDVRDAWWMMILRAMCWHRSVAWVQQSPSAMMVPSGLYGSRIPVYIA